MIEFIVLLVIALISLVALIIYDKWFRPKKSERKNELGIVNFIKTLVFLVLAYMTGAPDTLGEKSIKFKFIVLVAVMEVFITLTAVFLDATPIRNFIINPLDLIFD